MGGERLPSPACLPVLPHSLCVSQPQEKCNADELIRQFLAEMDAETNEEGGEEKAEAEMDDDNEIEEELADAGIALPQASPISVCRAACLQPAMPLPTAPFDRLLMCGRPEYFCNWAENGKACVTRAPHTALSTAGYRG